jgi:hypothetical protein
MIQTLEQRTYTHEAYLEFELASEERQWAKSTPHYSQRIYFTQQRSPVAQRRKPTHH